MKASVRKTGERAGGNLPPVFQNCNCCYAGDRGKVLLVIIHDGVIGIDHVVSATGSTAGEVGTTHVGAGTGMTAQQSVDLLRSQMARIGYEVAIGRGDYQEERKP